MYASLSEELREIISHHQQWLKLSNENPYAVLTEEEMGLRADLGMFPSLRDYDFSYVNLSYAFMDCVDFSGCNFTKANLKGVNARSTIFNDCLMISTCLRNIVGTEASFIRANLTHADLSHSFIEEANFDYAHCEDTKFHGTHADRAKMDKAYLKWSHLRLFSWGRNNLVASQIMRMAQ